VDGVPGRDGPFDRGVEGHSCAYTSRNLADMISGDNNE